MPNPIPTSIRGQKYISLATFRKNGTKVPTPVWFGEDGDKLYVMTRSDMGKTKRIRNNPQVTVAPCTIRGKVTGTEFAAVTRILPPEEQAHARQTINRKYWLARITSIFSRADAFFGNHLPLIRVSSTQGSGFWDRTRRCIIRAQSFTPIPGPANIICLNRGSGRLLLLHS